MAKRSTAAKRNTSTKRTPKSSTKTKRSTAKTSAATSAKSTTNKSKRSIKIRNVPKLLEKIGIWSAIFVVALVGIDYAVQYLNQKATVAIVNGERIYRKEFLSELEATYGYMIINQLISERVVYQKADAEGVSVTEEEIDEKIAEIQEKYGGEAAFEELLEAQFITMEELRGEYERSTLLEKLLADEISITEQEKRDFYDQYKDLYFPEDTYASYEVAAQDVETQLTRQKMEEMLQGWLSNLQDEATITNNIEDPKDYSFLGITRAFFSDLLGL